MVNAGLQALGIQAPPPPLVKSTMLGAFPIPTNTLQTVPKEEENVEADPEQEDQSDSEAEHDDADVPASSENSTWYDLDESTYENETPVLDSNRNEANVLHTLTKNVSHFVIRSVFTTSQLILISMFLYCITLVGHHWAQDWGLCCHVPVVRCCLH
jgi:hypothetical protein